MLWLCRYFVGERCLCAHEIKDLRSAIKDTIYTVSLASTLHPDVAIILLVFLPTRAV